MWAHKAALVMFIQVKLVCYLESVFFSDKSQVDESSYVFGLTPMCTSSSGSVILESSLACRLFFRVDPCEA